MATVFRRVGGDDLYDSDAIRQPGILAHREGLSGERAADQIDPGLNPLIGPRIPVVVRRARLVDLLPLSRINSQFLLDAPYTPDAECDPVKSLLKNVIPGRARSHPRFVATEPDSGQVLCAGQFRVCADDDRWVAEALATNVGVYDAVPVAAELLAHASIVAGLTGTRRVIARATRGTVPEHALLMANFHGYSSETVLESTADQIAPPPGNMIARKQAPSDGWAIHRLYLQSTPKEVQAAEDLVSASWDCGPDGFGGHVTAWLLESPAGLEACVRVLQRRDGRMLLSMMAADGGVDHVGALASWAIHRTARSKTAPIFVSVRGYQGYMVRKLQQIGFQVKGEQSVFVRYTTAQVRTSVITPVFRTVDEGREASPERAPSYYAPLGTNVPTERGAVGEARTTN